MRSPDCCDRASARCAILECVSGPRDTSNRADTALISDKSLIESSLTPELGVSAVLSRPGFASVEVSPSVSYSNVFATIPAVMIAFTGSAAPEASVSAVI